MFVNLFVCLCVKMESADVQLSSKLTTSLKRISDTLILSQQQVGPDWTL